MNNVWNSKADALKQNVLRFLSTASTEDLAKVAGTEFAALAQAEKQAVIAVLASHTAQ